MKIHVHPSLCDGHRECRRVGGEFFLLDEDGHLELRKGAVPPELEVAVDLAAASCPTHAITVIKEDGDHFR